MNNIRIPAWLIAICAFVFMGILLEQLYLTKRPVDLWGLKLNQPILLPENMFQSGNVIVGHWDTGWTLAGELSPPGSQSHANTRTYTKYISFTEKFDRIPNVSISISEIDGTSGGNFPTNNVRAKIEVIDKNESGFNVLVSTWDGSKLWGIGINWIAYVTEL